MSENETKRCELLVIDDDDDLLTTVRIQLQRSGYSVQTAIDGQSGLEVAFKERPEIILLDLGLPDIDGLEVARKLRASPSTAHAGILMFTARSDLKAMHTSIAAGVDDYIVKPYELDELISRVEMVRTRAEQRYRQNGLTGLMADNFVRAELRRRILNGTPFALGCVELDHINALESRYGIQRRDNVIRTLAKVLTEVLDLEGVEGDFLGQNGVDDFVFLTTPNKVDSVCTALFNSFNENVENFYDAAELERGYIEIRSVDKKQRRFPKIALSVGVATSVNTRFEKVHRVFEMASQAKCRAKHQLGNHYVIWGMMSSESDLNESIRLLIVEDDPDLAFTLACRLEREGYKCKTVDSAIAARNALDSFTPDLFILDVMLPGKEDGSNLAYKIRNSEQHRNTPIIMMSALNTDFDQLMGELMGADLYVTKPFDLNQVVKYVKELLEVRKSYETTTADRNDKSE